MPQQVHGAGVLALRHHRQLFAVAVGLVDHQRIGQFHDALLDTLQLVTAAGQHQHHEKIHHAGHLVLGLADADGFHEYHVVTGGLTQQHGLACLLRHAAQCALGRRGTDIRLLAPRQFLHAGFVAENGAPGNRRTGVYREHGNALALLDQVQAKGLDKRRFAHTGHPGNADPDAVARMRQHLFQDILRLLPMGIEFALNQRDCFGQGTSVAL